ncbi:MAG: coniferyl aldehyde dehydrogenase [Marinicaulis sp.]|nr:coniferyl aldehyde dehydrogenase [Marinicaulis sp.]
MPLDDISTENAMQSLLSKQKAAQLKEGAPTAAARIDRLDRAINLLVENSDALNDAVSTDFGHRSKDVTAFADTATSIAQLKFAKKHLRQWMKAERRSVEFPFGLLGASARVEFQPKGVVGVIAPWNFPVGMVFGPLAGVIAAGNRAMIKPSEFTENTSGLMKKIVADAFDETEVAVVTGGPEIGAAFTKLPFDHIVFTGSGSIARHIMRAASENLVPLTLELGGKSPAILGRSANFEKAATRVMHGKVLNAGQICLAPDYVLAPNEKIDEFVGHAKSAVETMMPSGFKENDDYTSIINQRHYERLQGYLDDAREKGGELVEINPKNEDFSQQPQRMMPPTLVLNPTDDMAVMQDEIFGPILPVKSYEKIDNAIDYVNAHDHPLGLYYFGADENEQSQVLSSTLSGGATINDVIFHVAQEDLPFGGVGPSGMGCYHGRDGFQEFSHKKSIYKQTNSELIKMIRPPYGDMFRKQIKGRIKN